MKTLPHAIWRNGTLTVSTDPDLLDKERLLHDLNQTYWARNLAPELIWQSIEGAIPFGLYDDDAGQIGFARVATDMARFAWISDVYVNNAWQGKGLGGWLMDCMLTHPNLQSIRRWMLATDDAYTFYQRFGFKRVADSTYMVRQRQ